MIYTMKNLAPGFRGASCVSSDERPYTFAQTNLSPSFFACDKAADHTFRFISTPVHEVITPFLARSAPGRLNHGKRRTPADVLVLAIANGIDREFGYRPPRMLQHAG